jgi:ketosteroid isomerase-like protein
MKDIREEISASLRAAAAALARGADTEEFAGLLYAEEIIVLGEGWPTAIRGLSSFMPQLSIINQGWGKRPRLTFRLVEPAVVGESAAASFTEVTCRPDLPGAEDILYRVLYVWKRTERGWRVVLEWYSEGSVFPDELASISILS